MRKGLLDILKGKFLVSGDAPKNWMFITFISGLAAVMIASSHNADGKVHKISALNEEVNELKNQYVGYRSAVQKLKLESTILDEVAEAGLFQSEDPPKKIRVKASK